MSELAIGDLVEDFMFRKKTGTVIKLDKWEDEPLSVENHGTVEVRFGDGVIEHYAYFGWERVLRIIK